MDATDTTVADVVESVNAPLKTLRIYMKSGNVVFLDRVVSASFDPENPGKLNIVQDESPGYGQVGLLPTLDPSQVEMMTLENREADVAFDENFEENFG